MSSIIPWHTWHKQPMTHLGQDPSQSMTHLTWRKQPMTHLAQAAHDSPGTGSPWFTWGRIHYSPWLTWHTQPMTHLAPWLTVSPGTGSLFPLPSWQLVDQVEVSEYCSYIACGNETVPRDVDVICGLLSCHVLRNALLPWRCGSINTLSLDPDPYFDPMWIQIKNQGYVANIGKKIKKIVWEEKCL